MSASNSADWWKQYFDEDFLRIYREVLDPDEPTIAAESIRVVMGLPPGARILDLACGWGRHALALAGSGLEVVGVDRSFTLLKEASAATGARLPWWVCADMCDLPFRPGSFDAVVCLFSSLGYFLSDDEDVRVLEEVRRLLTPRGRLLIETIHRDSAVRDYAERDWCTLSNGDRVFVEREFDAVDGVTREVLRWVGREGSSGEKHHAARIRTATEWANLLERAGLMPLGWYGGWDLEPFDFRSEMLLVLAAAEGAEDRFEG